MLKICMPHSYYVPTCDVDLAIAHLFNACVILCCLTMCRNANSYTMLHYNIASNIAYTSRYQFAASQFQMGYTMYTWGYTQSHDFGRVADTQQGFRNMKRRSRTVSELRHGISATYCFDSPHFGHATRRVRADDLRASG